MKKNSLHCLGVAMTAIIIFAVLTNGCSPKNTTKRSSEVPVLVAQSIATNVPVQIQPQPVGHVEAYSTVTVRPQIGGVLQQIHFKEGTEVKSNALLFTIDPRAAQATLARDKAQLENAEIQFNRDQKLFDKKLISQDEYDTSKANRDTLAATVQADELNLSYTEIRAPFDGIVGSVQFHEGNVVKSPDDILLTINRIHPIYVTFAVPERYLAEIKKQMRSRKLAARVTFDGMNGAPPQGELTFIDNAVDTTTGSILLKATFPNKSNVLWPGQFVRVELTLAELPDAVTVPSQAIQTGQSGQFIYVVKADQTVEQRLVTTGITYDGAVVVEKGLAVGETVVTDGQLRLVPGVEVNIKSANTSTNAP